MWWPVPLVPILWSKRQVDLCESDASLFYVYSKFQTRQGYTVSEPLSLLLVSYFPFNYELVLVC